jgi:hypothetical protein
VLVFCGIVLAVSAPATAQTSGNETLDIVLVTSGLSGTRTVVSSVIVAKGVFNGVGRIVEVENLPGDPDSVLRDDLVFAGGSIHLVSTVVSASFSLNPKSRVGTACNRADRDGRRRHRPVRRRERQLQRDADRPRDFAAQCRRQLLTRAGCARRGGQNLGGGLALLLGTQSGLRTPE